MKILTIEKKSTNPDIDIIEFIHLLAAANGSKSRINLRRDGEGVVCNQPYSNQLYTRGYYAILFLVDSLVEDVDIAYTSANNGGNWFSIKVNDESKLIEELS